MATAPKHLKDLDTFEQDYANSRTEYAALYDANGDLIVARHGGEKSVEFTPEELARARGGVLSHDHPHGHDLSSADMALATQHGIEVRATGHTPGGFKTYSVRSPKAYEDTSPLIQFYERAYQQEKAAGRDPYAAREATVARTARRFGLERRVFNRNDIVREGLETEGQRAYYFGVIAKGENQVTDFSNAKEDAISNKFKDSVKGITPDEAKSISDYSEHSFNINAQLRRGEEPHGDLYGPAYKPTGRDAAKIAANIDSAIKKSALPENVVLYRGINKIRTGDFADQINQGIKDGTIHPGSELNDSGFMSTSLKSSVVASQFSAPGSVMVKIEASQGTPGLHVGTATGQYDINHEVILPRNTKLHINSFSNETIQGPTKWDKPKDITVIHASIVKQVKEFLLSEGLETEEQRAWWFWHLKDGGDYSGPEKVKPESPFEKAGKQHEAIGKSIDQAKAASLGSKAFNKPMKSVDYRNLSSVHADDLTQDERYSVSDYTGSMYQEINTSMRTGDYGPYADKETVDTTITRIKSSIDKSELPNDISVYRGFSEKRFPNLKVGSTIEDKGFISTSTDQELAAGFYKVNPKGDFGKDFDPFAKKIFQIDLPKGHSGLAAFEVSQSPTENEVLLNPQSFKVSNIENRDVLQGPNTYHFTVYHLSPTGNGKSK